VTEVESFVRLTGRTFIHCCIYDDIPPILTVKDAHVDISITVPGRDEVTADDVTFGRLLAGAVASTWPSWSAGCPRPRGPDSYRGWRRAGGVMAVLIEAGRLELQSPAAPGFSPVASKEEVNSLCAGS